MSKQLLNILIKMSISKTFRNVNINFKMINNSTMKEKVGLSVCDERSFLWFSVESLETKVWILSLKWRLFCDSLYFKCYIVLHSSDFSVTGINNVYLSVVYCIFSLTFFGEVWGLLLLLLVGSCNLFYVPS